MIWLWQLVLSFLVWLSADPVTIATEPARAAAAVAAARAAIVGEDRRDGGVESMEKVPTPLFDAHAAKCKRCHNRNPRGPGLCEEGARLAREDYLKAPKRHCPDESCGRQATERSG